MAQALVGAGLGRFHGGAGHAQRIADLGRRQPGEAELDDVTLVVGELIEYGEQPGELIAVYGALLRPRLLIRERGDHRVEWASRTKAPPAVGDSVAGDGEEPAPEGRAIAVRVAVEPLKIWVVRSLATSGSPTLR